MAFKMNKPTIKGTVAHNKQLKLNRTGYGNLPDGRSKSSAFQQNEGPVDPSQMTVEDQIRMADEQFGGYDETGGEGAYAGGDYYDPTTFATDFTGHGMPDNTSNWVVNEKLWESGHYGSRHYHTGELHPQNFYNLVMKGDMETRIRETHGKDSDEYREYMQTFHGDPNAKSWDKPDSRRAREYVRSYNEWLGTKNAKNKHEPGSGDDYTFQDHQQMLVDINHPSFDPSKPEWSKYKDWVKGPGGENKKYIDYYGGEYTREEFIEKYGKDPEKNSPTTFIKRANPMDMSDRDMAVELVASGKFKTIQEAMDAVQADSPARNYKKGYYN